MINWRLQGMRSHSHDHILRTAQSIVLNKNLLSHDLRLAPE